MASSPTKAEPRRPSKHDAAVAEKLGGAIQRIRMLELMVGFCGLIVGFLIYGQVVATIDVRFPLPEVVRQLLLCLFLGGMGYWAYLYIYRPIRYGINPYYAAQVVEENTPGSRNGLLNWLDLQAAPESTAARAMVGQRAAREAGKADLERAINGDRATWFGSAAALLFLFGFILALLLGPRSFLNSLSRVFVPFTQAAVGTQATQITIVRPEQGDATILVGQAATVTVRLEGRVPKVSDPDAARIRYRHSEAEPWRELPLAHLENENLWEVVVPPLEVENGFDYQITAGGSTSDTHRFSVIAAPLIESFRATYFFREYTGRTFEVRRERPIDSLEGTEVELVVKTNRTLEPTSPRLEAEVPTGRLVVAGKVDAEDPTTFRLRFTLKETGTYRLHFASTRKDTYSDVQSYPLVARPDELPEVELTHPARDVQLAANGMLNLEGWASDREGVKNVTLQLQVIDGEKLQPQLYREMASFRQKHGTYPTYLKYRDQLDLTKLRDEKGKPFAPKVGSKIEYWLEATDACDLPGKSRVVASKHYFVEVIEVDPNAEGQAEQREQAGKDNAEHQKKQDEALAQEDAARKEENDRKEEAGNMDQPGDGNDPGEKNQGGNNPGDPSKPDPMNKQDGSQGNQGNQGGQNEQKKDEQDTLNQAEELKKALEQKDQKEGKQQGENKPGQGKEKNQDQGGESKQGGEGEQKAESKPGAGNDQKDQAGQGKEEGKEGMMGQQKPGEGKETGQQGMAGMGENRPEGKEGGQQGMGNPAGEGKPGEKDGERKPGQPRDQKNGMGTPGESKEGPQPGNAQQAQGKEANGQGSEAGEKKEAPGNPQPSQGKEGGEMGNMQAPPTGKEPPPEGSKTPGGENKPGEPRDMTQPPQQGQSQGATSKPGGERRDLRDPSEARPEDVEALKNQPASGSANGSDAAGKELERIQKEAKDPKVREAARQALEERKQNPPTGSRPGEKPGENKKGEETGPDMGTGQERNPNPSEKKPAGQQGMAGGEGGKPEAGMGQRPGEKAEVKEGAPTGMGGMGGQPMPGENQPTGKEMGMAPATGNQPGMGVDPNMGNQPGMGQNGPTEEVKPEQAAPTPPTELQLQKFRDAVTPDILKDLRMSPQEFEQFLKKYEQLAKRPGELRDPLPPSQPGAGNLPALGGGNRPGTTPGGSNPATGPGTINRPPAPPGYREAYSEFLRKLSQPERP